MEEGEGEMSDTRACAVLCSSEAHAQRARRFTRVHSVR